MDHDALDKLETRIDTKDSSVPLTRQPLFAKPSGPHAFGAGKPQSAGILARTLGRFTVLEYLFAGAIIFFVIAGAVAGLQIFSGGNTISTRNVQVSVSGPTSVRAGDIVSLEVVITNNNTVPMNLTDMIVEYPTGTRSDLDVSKDLPRVRESLGTIEPGATVTRTLKSVLFGARGAPVTVAVSAEYRVPSSNAVFHTDAEYHATISQAPVSIAVEALSEVVSGQETDIVVRVASNATEDLTGMLLVATYPPGFKFTSSSPAASSGSAVWDLGKLGPKDEKTVTIHGSFSAEDGDDRVVHFTAGTRQKVDESAIAAPLASSDIELRVAKPFVSVVLAIDGEVGTHAITRGQLVRGEVRWSNNLPVRVQDVEIEIKMDGAILDKTAVRADQAFFRSSDSTLLFTKSTDDRLADVAPGTTQISDFQFAALPINQGTFKNPTIKFTATVRAKRTTEGSVSEIVTSTASATALVQSDISVSSALLMNSGPIPPKVDQETIYTVSWTTNNSANALADTVVSGVLPAYVRWTGLASSNLTYNPTGRTVTWNIGDMASGAAQTAQFQIALTPSLTQVRSLPILVGDIRVTAFDRFIRAALERAVPAVTTQTSTTPDKGSVVE